MLRLSTPSQNDEMRQQVLIFLIAFFITTVATARDFEINFTNLIGPPKIITYHGEVHAVFDLGGMKYLFKVTKADKPYPQCDAVQEKGKELMVVGHNPKGYAYFVEKKPVAFKTIHSANWQEMVKKLNYRNCEKELPCGKRK